MIGAHRGFEFHRNVDEAECQRAFPDCGHPATSSELTYARSRWCAWKQRICRLWKTISVIPANRKTCRARSVFQDNKRKAPWETGLFIGLSEKLSAHFGHVCSLWTFLALHDFEFDLIALGERFETAATDRAEMDENVRPALARNE